MKRFVLCVAGTLCCVGPVAAQGVASSRAVIAPQPVAMRVALAEAVVVGKVTSIEEKAVSAPRFPNDNDGGEYQIAVVKVEDAVKGAQGLTHLKVGFIPAPAGPGVIRPGGYRPVTLAKDQEACLFLTPHFKASFLTVPQYFDLVEKTNPNYEKEVAEAKRCAKLWADPKAGLASKDAADRYTTAAMLLVRYTTPANPAAPGDAKKEPIDAVQSKAILEALAEADWTPAQQNPNLGFYLSPQALFNRLNPTEKDGWKPPMIEVMGNKQIDGNALPEAAKKWAKDNAGTYRIQRFVEDRKEEKKDNK
jgi:hypothetical protein